MSTATKTIHGYSAASTIDATADYLLIDPASTGNYLKINRNVLLGITGSPLGNTDTATISNKTLGITNTITSKDSLLTLQNASDVTKQVNFSLAGVSTGTTRTITLPNRSDTLVTLGGTETLTAKTLTSPTITGGSIDNTTITVDSISGHTSGTIVTVGGVQMNNGIVATTGAVNTNSLAAGAVVPNSLVASSGSGWASQTWAPTWTNFTVGNATTSYKYVQTGKMVDVMIDITFGSTSAMGTAPTFTLPVAAASHSNATSPIGIFHGFINSAGDYTGVVLLGLASNSIARVLVNKTDGTYGNLTDITASIPNTWTTGNPFAIYCRYEAA